MSVPKKEKLNFGAVGCGSIVERSFLPSIRLTPRAALKGVTRADPRKLSAFCKAHGIERSYESVESLLSDPDIDIVYIATPVRFHADQMVAAAEHGKHVLCEKPGALNKDEVLRARSACAANGVSLSIAYYRRAYPEIAVARRALAEGKLGQILSIHFHHGTWYDPDPDQAASWRIQPELGGGGVLMDVGSHRLDLVHLLGGSVRRVFCRLSRQVRQRWQVESGATALLELGDGGEAVVSVFFNQSQKTDWMRIHGSKANLVCPNLGEGVVVLQAEGKDNTIQVESTPKGQTHAPVINSVVDELLDGTSNLFSIEQVMPTEEILDACYRSAEAGRWIDIQTSPSS